MSAFSRVDVLIHAVCSWGHSSVFNNHRNLNFISFFSNIQYKTGGGHRPSGRVSGSKLRDHHIGHLMCP